MGLFCQKVKDDEKKLRWLNAELLGHKNSASAPHRQYIEITDPITASSNSSWNTKNIYDQTLNDSPSRNRVTFMPLHSWLVAETNNQNTEEILENEQIDYGDDEIIDKYIRTYIDFPVGDN